MSYISGAVGISVLQKGDRKIIIFYDDHNNKDYCEEKNFIHEFFEKKSKENFMTLLVEEPFFRENDFKFIWGESEHLKYFLNYFLKNTDKY